MRSPITAAARRLRRDEELAAIAAVGRAVNATRSVEEAAQAALSGILESVRPDMVVLFLREGEQLQLVGVGPAEARTRLGEVPVHRVGACLCGLAASRKQPLFVPDVVADPRCSWEECKRAGVKSFAAMPLIQRDEVVAVVGLASMTARDFAAQAGFLDTLATVVTGALANARLYETGQRELAERKRAEQALLDSQERLLMIFNSSRTLQLLVRVEPADVFRVVEVNQCYLATANRLGYSVSAHDLIGRTMEELGEEVFRLPPSARDEALGHYAAAARSGAPEVYEESVETPRGRFWSDVTILPVLDGAGRCSHLLWTSQDITERKLAQDALRTNEERLRLAISAANQGLYDLNVQTGEAVVSAEYAIMLGWDPAEFHETDAAWIERLHPDDRAGVSAVYRDYVAGRVPEYRVEFRQRTRTGDWKWILSVGRIVEHDPSGRPLRMLGTHTDITERRRAIEERERLQAQLGQAQKMESIGRLAGGVAHDFNNMLQSIVGNAELALRHVRPGSPGHDNLEEILRSATRSAELTRQLLAFARRQPIAPVVLKLDDVVGSTVKMLRRLINAEIELDCAFGAGLWTVCLDPSQVDQVLVNLTVNARDAIAGPGRVTIATANVTLDEAFVARHPGAAAGDYVMLTVRDTGKGMDSQTREHVFEPFFTTKAVGQGTGLGLATVFGIVTQNRGLIEVESALGRGTMVSVYFPRCTGTVAATPAVPVSASRGTETVLLAEDEGQLLLLITRVLEGLGYTVLAAPTPAAALALAASHPGPIHLLITDVMLPGMNGLDLRDRLAAERPEVKCLFISGYATDLIARAREREAGLLFLQKPFATSDLIRMIRAALDPDRSR